MNISWIQALDATVEHGSVGAAAKAHNMSRQGFRRRIDNLENATGVKLLATDARGTLTKQGQKLMPLFRRILAASDEVLSLKKVGVSDAA